MINHADIENVIGCKTLVTDRMQQAIEGWYDAAIDGLPMNHNPETLTLGLPSLICSELARLTTLELEVKVEGSRGLNGSTPSCSGSFPRAKGVFWPLPLRWAAAFGSPTRAVASWAFPSATPPATFPCPTTSRAV